MLEVLKGVTSLKPVVAQNAITYAGKAPVICKDKSEVMVKYNKANDYGANKYLIVYCNSGVGAKLVNQSRIWIKDICVIGKCEIYPG